MSPDEMRALLLRVGFGHLGCSRDDHPYVVPMHYAFDSQNIYFFTTEGTKTDYIAANHEVCFQVEEIADESHWQSVMAVGAAERLTKPDELEHAMQIITESHASLTPALNKTKIGSWTRLGNVAVYRLRPDALYGRKTS